MIPDIRVLSQDGELRRAVTVFHTALVGYAVPAEAAAGAFHESGRTLGMFSDDELVGTATSMAAWLVVPGGTRVPHCAVTDIGVLPTHTRRGVAGALIRRQFADAAARGEIVATLRASEAVIYERFGYGVATRAASLEVSLARAGLRPGVAEGGPIRLIDPADSWDLLARIYAVAGWTGAIARPESWWRVARYLAERGSGASYVAVHGEAGAEDGFARYHPIDSEAWFSPDRERTVLVTDVVAHNEWAEAALLRFLLSIDLVQRLQFRTLPIDHPLPALLLDERAVRVRSSGDETWLRLIDVPAALAARAYRPADSLVIDVTDHQIAANNGNYAISADGVHRTDQQPDLSLDVAALACVYLGGERWWRLARAGRVREHAPGALALADHVFGTDRAPFCGTPF